MRFNDIPDSPPQCIILSFLCAAGDTNVTEICIFTAPVRSGRTNGRAARTAEETGYKH